MKVYIYKASWYSFWEHNLLDLERYAVVWCYEDFSDDIEKLIISKKRCIDVSKARNEDSRPMIKYLGECDIDSFLRVSNNQTMITRIISSDFRLTKMAVHSRQSIKYIDKNFEEGNALLSALSLKDNNQDFDYIIEKI